MADQPLLERLQVVGDQLTESQLPSGDLRNVVAAIIAYMEGGAQVLDAAAEHAQAAEQAPSSEPVVPPAHVPAGQQTEEQRQQLVDQGLATEGPSETTPTPSTVAPVSEQQASEAEEIAALRARVAELESEEKDEPHPPTSSPPSSPVTPPAPAPEQAPSPPAHAPDAGTAAAPDQPPVGQPDNPAQ